MDVLLERFVFGNTNLRSGPRVFCRIPGKAKLFEFLIFTNLCLVAGPDGVRKFGLY